MPEKTPPRPQISPATGPFPASAEAGTWDALRRPERLKSWSSDLVQIVDAEAPNLFDDWSFAPGSLTRSDFGRIVKKVRSCGSILELRSPVDRETGEVGRPALHAANFCGQHTICPFCAGRVQDRRLRKWKKPIEWAAEVFPYAYMVTATTAPAESWRMGVDGLRDAWRRFYLKGQKRGSESSGGEWAKVKAGIAKMEIKRGDGSGLPHCHYHAILFTDSPLDYRVWSKEEKAKPKKEREPLYRIPWPKTKEDPRGWRPGSKLSMEWAAATDFSAIDFDCRPIRWLDAHRREGVPYAESVFMQSIEVLKYATKFDSSPATGAEKLFVEDYIGIKDATYNRRLFHTYGFFQKSARKDESQICPHLLDEDDFIGGGPNLSEGPLIFETRWRGQAYAEPWTRDKPVFKGQERNLETQFRRTMLNRVQGRARRMRTAILESKRLFLESGDLVRAAYMEIRYSNEGEKIQQPAVLEFPAYLLENPEDMSNWERWVDDLTDAFHSAYADLRQALNADNLKRGDLAYLEHQNRLDFGRRSAQYQEETARSFLEVLCGPPPEPVPYLINGPP